MEVVTPPIHYRKPKIEMKMIFPGQESTWVLETLGPIALMVREKPVPEL